MGSNQIKIQNTVSANYDVQRYVVKNDLLNAFGNPKYAQASKVGNNLILDFNGGKKISFSGHIGRFDSRNFLGVTGVVEGQIDMEKKQVIIDLEDPNLETTDSKTSEVYTADFINSMTNEEAENHIQNNDFGWTKTEKLPRKEMSILMDTQKEKLSKSLKITKRWKDWDCYQTPEAMEDYFNRNDIPEFMQHNIRTLRKQLLDGSGNWQNREIATAVALGHLHGIEKFHGTDAFKSDGTRLEYKINWCDATKPTSQLNGGGSFNDYDKPQRFIQLIEGNTAEEMVISCWINDYLIMAVGVPMYWIPLRQRLRDDYLKGKDRTCLSFNFTHWIGCPRLVWYKKPKLYDLHVNANNFQTNFLKALFEKFDE